MRYDDDKFQYPVRQWIPNPGAGHSLASAGGVNICARWYPKGPIKVVKFGAVITTAFTGTKVGISLKKGASATTVATINCSTTAAAWSIASKESLTQAVGAGSFLTIVADGTADTGSVCCFVDYHPTVDANWQLQ